MPGQTQIRNAQQRPANPRGNSYATPPKPGTSFDPTGASYHPSPTDPLGQGPMQGNAPGQAQSMAIGGRTAGGQLYEIGVGGIDPSTGQPYNTDSGTAGRLYQEAKQPIEKGFYDQSQGVASYLSRQGLGSSGINVGASQQLASNKEALESQAKMKAIDLAKTEGTQGILNDVTTQAVGNQPNMALYMQQQQINAQLAMLQQQLDAQMFGGMGQGLGSIAGLAAAGLI